MKSEYYKNILPFNENERVVDQFGWTPQSVITPTKSSKNNWEHAYLTAYEEKRGVCERLPNGLMMSEFHAGLCENLVHYWSMVGDITSFGIPYHTMSYHSAYHTISHRVSCLHM